MNMQSLMAQANKMKRDVEAKQEKIDKKEFIGKSQIVEVTMYGNKTIKNIEIDKVDIEDKEDLEMLQDMLVIAFNDSLKQIEKETEKEMGSLANGLKGMF